MPTTTLDFDSALRLKLKCFLDATGGSMAKFVRRAVVEQIDSELERNPGTKARYEENLGQALARVGSNISQIVPKRKTRKAISAVNEIARADSEPGR